MPTFIVDRPLSLLIGRDYRLSILKSFTNLNPKYTLSISLTPTHSFSLLLLLSLLVRVRLIHYGAAHTLNYFTIVLSDYLYAHSLTFSIVHILTLTPFFYAHNHTNHSSQMRAHICSITSTQNRLAIFLFQYSHNKKLSQFS